MADTIPGGAYQNAAGAWFDAEGKPLSEAQIAEAEKLHAARADALREEEEARVARVVQNDPLARTLARVMEERRGAAESAKPAGEASAPDDPEDPTRRVQARGRG